MIHGLIDLIVAGVTGYCDIHGTSSKKCGAAKELGGLLVVGFTLLGLGTMLSRK